MAVKLSDNNIFITFAIKKNIYDKFENLVQKTSMSPSQYVRMRVVSSLDNKNIHFYKTCADYSGDSRMVHFRISKEVRDDFQEICKRNEKSISDVIRSWIYECVEFDALFPNKWTWH